MAKKKNGSNGGPRDVVVTSVAVLEGRAIAFLREHGPATAGELAGALGASGIDLPPLTENGVILFKRGKYQLVDPVDPTADEADEPTAAHADGTRYLKCQLTPAEIDELREEREAKDTEIEQLQIDLAPAIERVKSIKSRIEILHEDGLRISRRVRDGYEMRDVPCQERRVDNEVVTIRLDTREEIDRRPLTNEERQGRLFDAPAVLTKKGKKGDRADLLGVD